MNGTVPLGRIAGVRVGMHWSVVGIVVVVAVGLAGYQLPAVFPGHSPVSYVLAGLAAAVLLLGSLLGHELAHAVVARRNGVAVEGITLWLLGGVARLRDEARSPGADLRIAVVGPAASAVLAVLFGALAWIAYLAGLRGLVVAVLVYLAMLNVVLAVFNLLPAAPLDGGRVLRAALWRWRGDRYQAAVWSARAGLGLGYLLVLAGFVQLIRQSTEGLWWILLGLFIVSVAAAEERQARTSATLAGIRVRDVMSHPVETADGQLTVEQFLPEVALHRHHASFPILDRAGAVEGLITLRGMRAVAQQRRATTALREIATPADRIPTADPDEPLASVLPRLHAATDGRLLVFAANHLVGIISPSDISRTVAEHGLPADLSASSDPGRDGAEPPPHWWYPGQQRPR
ncbi:site-2 protease family protein [Saccharopolyspora sp. K220]|uniref:site-2 protease family protein n=1 Tax=Saccharopolyspora soli TaxID=2926618 RepID=UPI001F598CCC|nr:site-2 protease family protein [Saccharopolyspora soli]MCI2417982.1 site-2 protease family protein [Saccharopolyspora soli]